jgi:hypothetical protein
MLHAPLRLGELICASVIARLQREDPARVTEVPTHAGDVVHVATAPDVLYVPSLGLQILEDRIVPTEGIVDEWNLSYEQPTDFHGRGEPFGSPFPVREVDETVCILSNFYSYNFTHCIEELFKVTILERAGYRGRYVLSSMPRFAFEFMELLGIPRSRLAEDILEPTLFRSAQFCTAIHFMNLRLYPDIFLDLRAALLAAVSAIRSPLGRRVWLDRGIHVVSRERDLVNEDEVYACIDRHGFERVDMGSLPLSQQIAIARDAHVIAGPHGSAFAHCMFMPTESTVIECFSPLFLNGVSFDICRVLNHLYFMVVDWNSRHLPYPFGTRVRINCSQLELALQKVGGC